ncbi:TetR/AcrR family transcriptional regulator [Blastochloris sulfoviridis]|uniref:TetR/AcrR family transcriptional regulator n=1 Tax=Blastochloris sulfoviridis TaxID=50712 RepID=A0A5M6I376_9HYPH|nr:TetR/AcrR family transcriptional regulator [Blastochloris sulfoviridis]KAA5602245.1 TetR/AcrR family transcriptional regulator [Blastochloris sulfoviridis]
MTDMSNGDNIEPAVPGLAEASPRERLIEAFLGLLAERRFEEIDLKTVGERAGVPLAEFRREFGSTFDIVAAFSKDLDRKVLAATADDDADATPRERLFDVMMQRFEILAPHRRAVENLRASGLRFPPLGMALGRLSLRSMQWMLAGAGIEAKGLRGMARAQGLAMLFARVSETWLVDDDPDLSRTMAALDRELARAWDWSTRIGEVCRMIPTPRCRRDRREQSWTEPARSGDETAPAAAI